MACCILPFLAACGEDELAPTPGDEPNYFAIPGDATDPESVIRRNFYEETGINLAFSDTLHKEQTGTDAQGRPVYHVETINLSYILTAKDDYLYVLDYITDPDEMEYYAAAVKNILARMKNEHPYSILLAHSINRLEYDSYSDTWEDAYSDPWPVVVTSFDCMAIAMGNSTSAGAEKEIGDNVVKYMLNKKLSDPDTDTEGFAAFSEEWYGADFYETDPEVWHQQGFIQDLSDEWWYPYQDSDMEDFIDAMFASSRQELEEEWAGYERILGKFAWLYNFAEANGYVIE